jgi:cytochrome c556
MSRIAILALWMSVPFACSGTLNTEPKQTAATAKAKDYLHSKVLNEIMKNEVNKPFSKLAFFVFHSDGEFDFAEIARTTAIFHAGVKRVRAFPDPPVQSQQGREVFATFLETLDRDCTRLTQAIGQRDSQQMQSLLGRVSRTCNDCHHFFRLDIEDSPEQ